MYIACLSIHWFVRPLSRLSIRHSVHIEKKIALKSRIVVRTSLFLTGKCCSNCQMRNEALGLLWLVTPLRLHSVSCLALPRMDTWRTCLSSALTVKARRGQPCTKTLAVKICTNCLCRLFCVKQDDNAFRKVDAVISGGDWRNHGGTDEGTPWRTAKKKRSASGLVR